MDKLEDCSGIEFNFVKSWNGWDELGVGDLMFYDIVLREDVFGSVVCGKYNGGTLSFIGSNNTLQLYAPEDNSYVEYKMHITLQPKDV